MNKIWFEILVIFLLLIINGIFAMAEIAVISSRKGRLRQLADRGSSRAKTALSLAESPNRFLATVQIGITLVGVLAGAFGGATIAEAIDNSVQTLPLLAPYGESIGIGVVVIVITYFSLVLGELVPKRIGLGNPEGIAMLIAKPVHLLSLISGPAVKLLSLSTELLLRMFRFRSSAESTVTEEEIRVMMQEGLRSGAFNKVESEIVHSALELDQWTVRDVMTPRIKIIWLGRDDPQEMVWHKTVVSGHSNFPVYEGRRDHVVGVVSVKAIYANLAVGLPAKVSDLMIPPLIVPGTQSVLQLLDTYRKTGKHVALVVDEFGGVEGLVTLNDVMQAIVGDFPSMEERLKPDAKRRGDGTWLIDGMLPIQQLRRVLPGIDLTEILANDVQTAAGFIMKQLGHIPKEGEKFEFCGYVFEIIDMDRHRVDKVLIGPRAAKDENLK